MVILDLVNNVTPEIVAAGGGLSGLQNWLVTNWLGPIYFIMIAAFSLIFIKDRAWMKLATFILIAAVVGILIFFTSTFFGKNGSLTKTGKTAGSQINTIDAPQFSSMKITPIEGDLF